MDKRAIRILSERLPLRASRRLGDPPISHGDRVGESEKRIAEPFCGGIRMPSGNPTLHQRITRYRQDPEIGSGGRMAKL